MKFFNYVFCQTLDRYSIHPSKIAALIDRDVSRVRRWKKNELPSKYVLHNLSNAIAMLIEENSDCNTFYEYRKHFLNYNIRMESSIKKEFLHIFEKDKPSKCIQALLIFSYHFNFEIKQIALFDKIHSTETVLFKLKHLLNEPQECDAYFMVQAQSLLVTTYSNLANYYDCNLCYKELMCIYHDSLKTFSSFKDPLMIGDLHFNMGLCAISMYDYHRRDTYAQEALSFLNKAKAILTLEMFPFLHGKVLLYIAKLYRIQFSRTKNLIFFDMALDCLSTAENIFKPIDSFFSNDIYYEKSLLLGYNALSLKDHQMLSNAVAKLDHLLNTMDSNIFDRRTYSRKMEKLALQSSYYCAHFLLLASEYINFLESLQMALSENEFLLIHLNLIDYPLYHGQLQLNMAKLYYIIYQLKPSKLTEENFLVACHTAKKVFTKKDYPEIFGELNTLKKSLISTQ